MRPRRRTRMSRRSWSAPDARPIGRRHPPAGWRNSPDPSYWGRAASRRRGDCVWVSTRAISLEVRCGPADWAVVTGWQKLLLGLAFFLPIPMLAMSGLALPLPAAVYRAATAFVESTQGFAGVLTEKRADSTAPAPVLFDPVADRQAVERPTPRLRGGTWTSVVRARARGAAPAAAERTSTVVVRRPTRSPVARPAVVESARTGTTSAADAAAPRADAGQTAAPAGPTPGTAAERPSRPVEVLRVEPVAPPVSPPPAPSPPAPAPPPPALEPVTQTLEPVTKLVEPVTKPVEPVTKPVTDVLDPITAPVFKTGRLLAP
jgi:hypothetical protein